MDIKHSLPDSHSGELSLSYIERINYALLCYAPKGIATYELTNTGEAAWEHVCIRVEGQLLSPIEEHIDVVPAGRKVSGQLNIRPDIDELARRTETTSASFSVTLSIGDEQVMTCDGELQFMPFDHWLGVGVLPELIASFVTPNHPLLSHIIVEAQRQQEKWGRGGQMDAYQTCNPNRVRAQVAAIFEALRAEGLVYAAAAPSFEKTGQRVRMAEKVLTEKLGNCLDLTLLFASCLEAASLNPIVVIVQGHAFVGCWLRNETYQNTTNDDAAFLLKAVSDGTNDIVVVETTMLTQSGAVSFESAVQAAEDKLHDEAAFQMSIDIKRCRLDNIRPLTQTIAADGSVVINNEGIDHKQAAEEAMQRQSYDFSQAMNARELSRQAIWERKLLDFTMRNNLLNTRIGKRAVQFVSFDIDHLEDILQTGVNYSIQPWPKQKNVAARTMHDSTNDAADLRELVVEQINSHRIYTYLNEEELKPSLTALYRNARTALEENGANSLFIAIGMLKWYETPVSELPRYAPILLLPVDIVRNGAGYVVRTRDEEIILNITLVEFLNQEFKLQLPTFDPMPRDESGVDVRYIFAAIRNAIRDKSRWNLMEESLLGLFSFSKFVMWNDIHTGAEKLQTSPVVASLMQQRLLLDDADKDVDIRDFDTNNVPATVATPISVDSSQLKAVIESGKGKSFILYGPPGTGKSQTITNIIANAMYQGKRVLFVAEKMAALSVVQRRLAKIGLDPFCLELHSNKVTKSHFLNQLQQALDVTHGHLSESFEIRSQELFNERKALNNHLMAMHGKGKSGLSVYDCIERYANIPIDQGIEINKDVLMAIDEQQLEELTQELSSLDTIFQITGHPAGHPLASLRMKDNRRDSISQLETLLRELSSVMQRMDTARKQLNTACGINVPDTIGGYKWLEELSDMIAFGTIEALKLDADELRRTWLQTKAKWLLPRYLSTRKTLTTLRAYKPDMKASDIDSFINRLADYEDISLGMGINEESVVSGYRNIEGGARNWQKALKSTQEQWHSLLRQIDAICMLPDCDTDYAATLQRNITQWLQHTDMMRDWYRWNEHQQQLEDKGLKDIVRFITDGHTGKEAALALQKTAYTTWATEMIEDNEALRSFNGLIMADIIERYKQLTEHFQKLTEKELYCRLAKNIPSVTSETATNSEVNILKRNIANGGRGTSIRHIIDQIPNLLPRLCPCMLMSPISVAQFIDLDSPKFDLVIFDEASQMPTSEAIGAIGRGKALIVVGDNKQMPPTSFFNTTNVDEDEADLDDLDSILDDCHALSMADHYLAFHYRSKHESLIAFSNQEYYDGRLYTFPSADDRVSKVTLQEVEGSYDKGGRRSNLAEAEAVTAEILRRLADDELSKRSIGVVAFSVAQQNLIEDVLTEALAKHPDLEAKATQGDEPIFIKNLENVQGDERDVILFSIGYGPDKHGNVSMNFGPLNNRGGERRLNVAVSRARYEMMVFSTLKPEQIDLRRSQAAGVAGLRKFLEYAQQGSLSMNAAHVGTILDRDIPREIADALKARGCEATTAVGRSQFKVDVAVPDPEEPSRYILGILIDGRAWAATEIARDRELTRPSVLTGLGWHIMRVWTIEWMHNREQVLEAIMQAVKTRGQSLQRAEAPHLNFRTPTVVGSKDVQFEPALTPDKKRDIETVPVNELDKAIVNAVRQHVALPMEDLLRVVSRSFGYQRRGQRADDVITRRIAELIVNKTISRDGQTIKLS